MAVVNRRYLVILFCGLTAGLLGCQEEPQVRRYVVPKEESAKKADEQATTRLLAAIFEHPQTKNTWFFKLVGPSKLIAEHAAAFDEFVRSVRFKPEAKDPVAWKVPEGWRAQAASGLGRVATFRIGPKELGLELRVNQFGRQGGTTLDNVNRWREQDLGLPKVGEEELPQFVRPVEAGGTTGTLVDMTGPGGRKGTGR